MDDVYTWIAHYHDGGMLAETEDRPWADVDQSRLKAIELHPLVEGFAPIVVSISPGNEGIFFRRRTIEIDMTTGTQTKSTVTCVGWTWQQTDQLFLWIYPDGSIKVTDHDEGKE